MRIANGHGCNRIKLLTKSHSFAHYLPGLSAHRDLQAREGKMAQTHTETLGRIIFEFGSDLLPIHPERKLGGGDILLIPQVTGKYSQAITTFSRLAAIRIKKA